MCALVLLRVELGILICQDPRSDPYSSAQFSVRAGGTVITFAVMTSRLTIVSASVGAVALNASGNIWAAEETEEDSAEGLPDSYAKNYLVARSTMSPDKKFAVIYPTVDFSGFRKKRQGFFW